MKQLLNIQLTLLFFLFLVFQSAAQGNVKWHIKTKGGIYSSPVVDDQNVYFGNNDSCFYSLDKNNGSIKWKYKTGGAIPSRPLVHEKLIIFNCTDGIVYALDKTSGKIKWRFIHKEKKVDMWDYYISSPVYHNKTIFIGSGDGNVYAIDVKSGLLKWKFKTDGVVHADPLIFNDNVYIGSFDGYLYAIQAQTGLLKWKFKTVGATYFPNGEIPKAAAVYNNTIIFGSRDYNIYALNAETGRGMWNMKEYGSWIVATPLVYNDTVCFGTSDTHSFYALSANDGKKYNRFTLNMRVYSDAVVNGENIYFGCFNGKIYKLNHSKNQPEVIFQTRGSKKNYSKVFNGNDEFIDGFELYGDDMVESEKKLLSLGSIVGTPVIDESIMYIGDANGVFYAISLE